MALSHSIIILLLGSLLLLDLRFDDSIPNCDDHLGDQGLFLLWKFVHEFDWLALGLLLWLVAAGVLEGLSDGGNGDRVVDLNVDGYVSQRHEDSLISLGADLLET